jgi:hypothetical protein
MWDRLYAMSKGYTLCEYFWAHKTNKAPVLDARGLWPVNLGYRKFNLYQLVSNIFNFSKLISG